MTAMDDEAERIQTEIFRRMTPEQKWNLGLRLRRSAQGLKVAWIRKMHPDWSDQEVRNELRRYFGGDRT